MKVARACAPASARLSLQAMRLSYFKNSDFTSSLQRNITLRLESVAYRSYFTKKKKTVLFLRCAISDICAIMCVCMHL